MGSARRRRVHASRSLLLAGLLLAGCTQTKFVPPSADLRAHLGNTAVVAMPTQPTLTLGRPVGGAGSGALAGAGEGAAAGVPIAGGGCMSADAFACALGLALGAAVSIVATPIGAVAGAMSAHSEAEVAAADTSLHAAFAEMRPAEGLRDRITAPGSAAAPYRLSAFAPPAGTALGPALSANGFDSALEITVTDWGLTLEGKIDPDASLYIAAEARLAKAAQRAGDQGTGDKWTELYRRKWLYVGVSQNYFKEGAANAGLLRSQVAAGLDKLAARIRSDLFVATAPEIKQSSASPGTVITMEAPILQEGVPLAPTPAPISTTTSTTTPAATTAPATAGTASAGPAASSSGTTASASQAPPAASSDVPFSVEIGGNSYDGVATLSHGHIAGRLEAFGRPVSLEADVKDNAVTARLAGALDARNGSFGANCVADGEASPATGAVTLRMLATCPIGNAKVVLRLELPPPPAAGGPA